MSPFVMVFPRGQLTPKDKERLTKSGIVAVEADDPKAVVRLDLAEPLNLRTSGINGDQLVRAALSALAGQEPSSNGGFITNSGLACHQFVKQLASAMLVQKMKDTQ